MSATLALFYMRGRNVETEFSQETVTLMTSVQCDCYSSFCKFVRSHPLGVHFFPNSVQSKHLSLWHHLLLMALQKQDKGATSVEKSQGSLRI